MRAVSTERIEQHREIDGQLLSGRDKFVPPPYWTDLARIIWPEKTAAHLASIGGRDERTAKRWLSGEYDPPMPVVTEIIRRMFEPRQ